MRKNRVLIAAFALAAIALLATSIKTIARPISSSVAAEELSLSPAEACGATEWRLIAGQTIDVGTVTVSNDKDNLYVTYKLENPNASFGSLHLWVGNDFLNMPTAAQGQPKHGHFPYFYEPEDEIVLTSYMFTIPFKDLHLLNITDATQACYTDLLVVTHAEVDIKDGSGSVVHETAYGGDQPGSGPRWWFFGKYRICCNSGSPQPAFCQTAFAKGGDKDTYVWTTDKKSNPDNLPSLNLTKNRWGWAIKLTAPDNEPRSYDIWAGAGLNNTGNGMKVGTLTVNWNGYYATVKYEMLPKSLEFPGYYLGEAHLYAGDGQPTTIAPGQYGNQQSFYPRLDKDTPCTFIVELKDTDGNGEVWIVAHAVVSNQQQ